MGGGRRWRADEGDAAPSITDKTNDAQTDGTRLRCHVHLVSSYNNQTPAQRMLTVTVVTRDKWCSVLTSK